MPSSADYPIPIGLESSLIRRDPIIVSSDTAVIEAIAQMDSAQMNHRASPSPETGSDAASNLIDDHRHCVSCVLVVQNGQYAGMLSERDVIHLVAQRRALDTLSMQQVMDRSDIALRESDLAVSNLGAAFRLDKGDRSRYPYLPVLDEQNYPIGLVSCEALARRSLSAPEQKQHPSGALQRTEMTQKLQDEACRRQQIEASLIESERTNRTLIDTMPDLLIQMDRQGNYSRFAGGTAIQAKPLPEPIDAQNVYVGLSPELAQQRLRHANQALDSGCLQVYEQSFDRDGDLRYEEVRIAPLNGQEVLIIIRDITERKRSEAQLQSLIAGTAATTGQDFFPALTHHISETLEVSHVIVTEQIGPNLNVLACSINGTLQPEFSYQAATTPCEQVLRHGSFYCSSLLQQAFPEDNDLVEMGVESYLGVALRNSSGEKIGTLCILDERLIPKPEWAEQILRVFAARAAAELERQRAKSSLEQLNQQLEAKVKERTAELREREQFLQTVLDTFPLSVFWKDRNSVYLGCNQNLLRDANLKSVSELIGKTDYDMPWSETEAESYRANDRHVVTQNVAKLGSIETQVHADGSQLWLETNKLPLRNLEGEVIGVLGTYQDITERKRAEQALQDSEQRFRSAIANAPFPIMIRAEDDEVLQINAVWTELTGYTHDEIATVGDWVKLACGDRAASCLQTIHENYSLTARRDDGEFAITTRDGSQRIWLITTTPLAPLPDGRRVTMAMAVDITTRRQAELALRESEERYRTIYNQAAMGLVIATADGRLIDVNPHICAMLGYSREEILSKTVEDITHPDDRQNIVLARDLSDGAERTDFSQEKRYIRKDGSTFWAATGLSFVRGADDESMHCIAAIRDINDRKRAEAQVHALLNRTQFLNRISSEIRDSLDLDIILHNLVNGVVAELPVESCVFAWYRFSDSSERSSHLLEAVMEKKVSGLQSCIGTYTYDDCPDILEHILDNRIYRIERLADVEDGKLLEHLQSVGLSTLLGLPIHTAGGAIGAIVLGRVTGSQPWRDEEIALFQSIANQVAIAIYQAQLYEESQAKTQQLERSYQELQDAQIHMVQAEKMSSLGQLVAGIAHEINNPVGFIYGNLAAATDYVNSLTTLVQHYQDAYPEPPQAIAQLSRQADIDYILEDFPKLLSSMENGATRIQAIVQSLRTFSRLEQVGQSAVDINQRIDNTLVILQNRLNGRAGKPEVEVVKLYGDLSLIECYGSLLDQVFINLLANAVDAIEERQANAELNYAGRIAITTAIASDTSVSISIQDNGIGMAAETQASIFDPFFTTKPIGVGTGMGLSISYQIVAGNHNGKLYCRSAPGGGTEFVVEIPKRLSGSIGPVA